MNELTRRRQDRRRKRLLAAVVTRCAWIMTGFALFYFTQLPLRTLFLYVLAGHFILNSIVLANFYYSRFVDVATLVVISGDVIIISLGILITGGLQSPFVLVLPVVVSLTILLADAFKGYYIASLASLFYASIGYCQYHQSLSQYITLKTLEPVTIIFYLLFACGALFSIAILMAYVMKRIETSEENLFNRGEELQISLAEINTLKTQQDGDYFLTSLLIDPLQINSANSDLVKVRHRTQQKKKFKFKRFNKELGGDICISHRIFLQGKAHVLFLNADAMGKSMQGAGGALVLGSVFQAQVERLRSSLETQNQFAERFLYQAFLDLQKVFESFDGSMLISLVMGLIEEDTGLLYFVNAEHPHVVLYRDKRAEFLVPKNDYKKVGTPGYNQSVEIETFKLTEKDILILGSDGRDDLVTQVDEKGNRHINHDENQFLRLVEEAEGDIEGIFQLVEESGEIIDDISIMTLSFSKSQATATDTIDRALLAYARSLRKSKDFAAAITYLGKTGLAIRRHRPGWRELILNFMQQKNFSRARLHLHSYLQRFADDNEMIYFYSVCLTKIKQYKSAVAWGQRVYYREKSHIRNALNLAKTYAILHNYHKANELIDEILANEQADEKESTSAKTLQTKLARVV